MTNKEILQADMLDILFEHRNKSYGAYTLRRHYNNRLFIALGIALSAVLLFYLISLLNGSGKAGVTIISDPDGVVLTAVDIKPPKEIEPPASVKKAPAVAQVKNSPIQIVPDPLADVVPDQTQIATSAISDKTTKGLVPDDLARSVSNAPDTSIRSKPAIDGGTIFEPKEFPPSFPGGPEALALFFSRTLSSPSDLEAGEKKVVLVRFVVGADGTITKAEVAQSGGDSYDREVLRAFKRMPRWNPAMQNGNKIAVSFTQPVTFVGVEQ